MEDIYMFKRIKWRKIYSVCFFLLLCCCMAWVLFNLFVIGSEESFFKILLIIISVCTIYILVLMILQLTLNNIAIIVENKKVIIRNHKERIIDFSEIENIDYILNRPSKKLRRLLGLTYKSGRIMITLTNGETFSVYDVKDAQEVCFKLRELVLSSRQYAQFEQEDFNE